MQFHNLLAEELNVVSLAVETDLEKFQQVELRPNFKSLGAKVKGDLPAVKAALEALDLAIEDSIALEVWLPTSAPELAAEDWKWVQSETRASSAELHRKAAPQRAESFEVDGVVLGFAALRA